MMPDFHVRVYSDFVSSSKIDFHNGSIFILKDTFVVLVDLTRDVSRNTQVLSSTQ
jgi:hypothetical protein